MTAHRWGDGMWTNVSMMTEAMLRDRLSAEAQPAGGLPGGCQECELCGAFSFWHPALEAKLLIRRSDFGRARPLGSIPVCPETCEETAELVEAVEAVEDVQGSMTLHDWRGEAGALIASYETCANCRAVTRTGGSSRYLLSRGLLGLYGTRLCPDTCEETRDLLLALEIHAT